MKDPLVEHISSNWNAQASGLALWVLFLLFHCFSCWGTPDSSAKFTQRSGRDEVGWRRNEERRLGEVAEVAEFWLQRPPTLALSAPAGASNVYTSKSALLISFKQCFIVFLIVLPCFVSFKQKLHFSRYMCTTDPAQCSTEQCHCEDPSHVRKAVSFRMRWVNKKGSEKCQIARKCRRWIGQLAICCTLKLSITDHGWKTSSQWCPQTWTEVYAFSSWLSLVALIAFSYIQMVAFNGTANLSAMSR